MEFDNESERELNTFKLRNFLNGKCKAQIEELKQVAETDPHSKRKELKSKTNNIIQKF